MKLVLQITFAVLLAFSLMTLGGWALTAAILHQGSKAISQTIERSKLEAEQARQIAERRRIQAEARNRAEAAAQREQEARERAAASTKRRAWTAYYEDPKECLTPRSEQHAVECVNQRMRARREFEQQYSP